jgi:predicted phosphoadenosine phosphosulfate sulfurtransferase
MVDKINHWVKLWENRCYKAGIPDTAPIEVFNKVPSYKRIVISIIKNDTQLLGLGFTRKESKYYGMLKRKELQERGIIKKSNQLKIFSHENIAKENLARKNKN